MLRVVRQPPRALVSPAVIAPGGSPERAFHRRLLLAAYPERSRAVAMATLVMSWLHWATIGARRQIGRVVEHRGERIGGQYGLSSAAQRRMLWRLALVHGVQPTDVDNFGLFSDEARAAMWANVYTNEIEAFHHVRSDDHSDDPSARRGQRRLLSNKRATCTALADLGIAVPELLTVLGPGSTVTDISLDDGPVFVRPNVGNAARGACRVARGSGETRVAEPVIGKWPDDTDAYLQKFLDAGDVLVEQVVDAHPAFIALGCPADLAVVARCIAEQGSVVAMFVEVPVRARDNGPNAFVPMQVDLRSGAMVADLRPVCARPADSDLADGLAQMAAAATGMTVPHLTDLIAVVEQASVICPDICGVAWDVAVGPVGPIVLEANTGWAIATPQRILGPFASRTTLRTLSHQSCGAPGTLPDT